MESRRLRRAWPSPPSPAWFGGPPWGCRVAYEERNVARQKVRRGDTNDDNPLVYQLAPLDEGKVTPTSATITIYGDHASSTKIVDGASMTVDGTLLTYSVDTTTTSSWPVGQYRADIVVTYDSKTYPRHLRFDVVPYIFDMSITRDQLVALDDNVAGMLHDGDSDFKALIAACAAVMQARLETKAIQDKRLTQEMLIDHTQVAVAQRFYILSRIYLNRGKFDMHNQYRDEFDEIFASVVGGARYDTEQGGTEPEEIGGVDTVRFEL